MDVSFDWRKGNVTPTFKKARGRILRTQGSILFNNLDVTFSASSQLWRTVDTLDNKVAIGSYFGRLQTETLWSLTKANVKSCMWDRTSPGNGRGQHGLTRKQLCRKKLGSHGGQRAEREPAVCWPATDSYMLGCTSKTGQKAFPFICHPWDHISQFWASHYKENIDIVERVQWRATKMSRGLKHMTCKEKMSPWFVQP